MSEYRGRLYPDEQERVREGLNAGLSVRAIAKHTGLPYGQVRGYVDWLNQPEKRLISPPETGPKVLFFDIETAPALGWVWRWYDSKVIELEQDWYILAFAYKWEGTNEVGVEGLDDQRGYKAGTTDDRLLVEKLHHLLDQADIVIGHNGDKFDLRKANARFLVHDLPPPSPYQTVDTLKEARRYFSFMSNRLSEIAKALGLSQKEQTGGFGLWRDCMRGDPSAWQRMKNYNRQDVLVLEEIYYKLLPYIGSPGKRAHPNRAQWTVGLTCPKCGSDDLVSRGTHRTSSSVYRTFQCKNCKGYTRSNKRDPETKVENL